MKLSMLNISPTKEAQLNRKGIFSAEDLVEYLPIRYQDFSAETGILTEDQVSCLVITLDSVSVKHGATSYVLGRGTAATGEKINLWWFRQTYLYDRLQAFVGLKVFVAGKVKYSEAYDSYSISSVLAFDSVSKGRKIYPVYSKIPGMGEEYLRERLEQAFEISSLFRETIPYDVVTRCRLLPRRDALYQLHFPQSMAQLKRGRERMIFDDLLYYAIQNELAARNSAIGSPYQVKSYGLVHRIIDSLPYALTEDQASTVREMFLTMKSGKRLNALVQGDVGCGKTIVSFLIMAGIVESGYQALIMAPTQVLAGQHYEDLKKLVEPLGYHVSYLSSEQTPSEQKQIKAQIADGTAQFIVGTTSVLAADITYHDLAIAVVDEEHRFGVLQREALVERAAVGVHIITMSATPIPRSLAQAVYGNLIQLHTIRSMPSGRKPVLTGIQSDRMRLYRFVRTRVQKYHQQVYVVCPMIDPSEDMEGVESIEEVSKAYRVVLEPYGIRIATLTGRDKKAQTEETIQAFRRGEVDVLIATTVIEVGVNVPNAAAMIIMTPDRYGLATLHQLRGRVGRSDVQSYCVLVSSGKESPKGRLRLEAMCRTTDGFQIAEEDLKLRGAGDILGTRQSGENHYLSLMLTYPERYAEAQVIAADLLDRGITCPLMEQREV